MRLSEMKDDASDINDGSRRVKPRLSTSDMKLNLPTTYLKYHS